MFSFRMEEILSYSTRPLIMDLLAGSVGPPHLHIAAPPLIISEEELLDGFEHQINSLYALDEALGY